MMRKCFSGTEINLLSEKMHRTKPDDFAKSGCGRLYVQIEIIGIKTVFLYANAEDILSYGQCLADSFVANIIKTAYPEKFE